MKIQPIFVTYNSQIKTTKVASQVCGKQLPFVHDSFAKANPVSFAANDRKIDKKTFNPLRFKDDKNEIREYAEMLHETDTATIRNMCYQRYHSFLFGDIDVDTAETLLTNEINKVKELKAGYMNRIEALTQKEIKGLSNVSAQKYKIQKELILPIKTLKNAENIPVPNGVLLYGDLSDNEKNKFVVWLKQEVLDAGGNFERVEYDMSNKAKSKENILQRLDFAKKYYSSIGHTVLFVDGIDKLFTDLNDDESIYAIDDFKNLIENCSKNYNVTFLIKTNLDIDDFDSAVIGDQRISEKYELKEGITENELKELESVKEKIRHLDGQAFSSQQFFKPTQDHLDWFETEETYETYKIMRGLY